MKISIVTVSYNDHDGLVRTMGSVRKQTSKDYEYIVMDGGSTDGSLEVIKANADIITFWESKHDGGPFFGMNNGLEHATGDYCIFMNSGDSFYDDRAVEQFVNINPVCDIYSGITLEHTGGGVHVWKPVNEKDVSLQFFYRRAFSHQSSFIRTELMKKLKYDTKYKIVSDWKFFLQALLFENASYEPLPFYVSHYMDGGISRDATKAFKERDMVFCELFGNRILRDLRIAHFGRNKFDALAKKVDPKSKIGKIIISFTEFMLRIRNYLSKL